MSTTTMSSTGFEPLGDVSPKGLADARLQLHHAVQVAVSAAISYLPARSDDSHTNLEWLPDVRALAGNVLPGPDRLRIALAPAELTLLSLSGGGEVRSRFPLDGRVLPEALAWLGSELQRSGLSPDRLTTAKHYEIPRHPVAERTGFRRSPSEAFFELERCYHDAWLVTSTVASAVRGASVPRCWPHHFDLSTLITLAPARDGSARTIGVGLSPGDESFAEPYFYVGPYPYPPVHALGPLPRGHWHTSGWVGAFLRVSDVIDAGRDAGLQRAATFDFVEFAVAALRRAMGDA